MSSFPSSYRMATAIMPTVWGVAVAWYCLGAALYGADCGQAGNLVPNCGFDVDLTSWSIGAADASSHVAGDGAFAPGSIELDREDTIEAIELFSSCMVVSPDTVYNIGAAYRLVSGPFAQACLMSVWEFTDAACIGFLSDNFASFTPVPEWSERFDRYTTGAATGSVLLRIACSYGKNDFIVRFDDVLFGEALSSDVVFNDGFESGYHQPWDSVVP